MTLFLVSAGAALALRVSPSLAAPQRQALFCWDGFALPPVRPELVEEPFFFIPVVKRRTVLR